MPTKRHRRVQDSDEYTEETDVNAKTLPKKKRDEEENTNGATGDEDAREATGILLEKSPPSFPGESNGMERYMWENIAQLEQWQMACGECPFSADASFFLTFYRENQSRHYSGQTSRAKEGPLSQERGAGANGGL